MILKRTLARQEQKLITLVCVSLGFVMRLAEDIHTLQNYKLFYDDWFCSIGLAKKLKDEGIYSLSIVRPNRLKSCKLKEENQLKNEGRECYDYRVETKRKHYGPEVV